MDNRMKLKIKHKMTFDEADVLIEKYYDGFTTVEDERQLREFLSQAQLPAKYAPEQAIFGYLAPKVQKPVFSIRPYMRWASVAAVFAATIFSVQLFITDNQANFAYVDGVKITDMQHIKSEALASLNSLNSNEVETGLNQINSNDIIKQQLDAFAAFE
jgi:hypothetical protein